jgi:hypothetical protein
LAGSYRQQKEGRGPVLAGQAPDNIGPPSGKVLLETDQGQSRQAFAAALLSNFGVHSPLAIGRSTLEPRFDIN